MRTDLSVVASGLGKRPANVAGSWGARGCTPLLAVFSILAALVAVTMPVMGATDAGVEDGGTVPAEFDCGMRALAMTFAASSQKGVVTLSQLQELADALNGAQEAQGCNVSLADVPTALLGAVRPDGPWKYATPADRNTFWVDPVHGSDSGPGTEVQPFKTLARGLEGTRSVSPPRNLMLRAGTFVLTETLQLSGADNGTTIQNYNGEEVWISGGSVLPAQTWTQDEVRPSNGSMTEVSGLNCVYAFEPGPDVWPNGTVSSADECRSRCEANYTAGGGCNVYTWHDGNVPAPWTNLCVFRFDGARNCPAEADHVSGWLVPALNVWKTSVSVTAGSAMDRGVPGLRLNNQRLIQARYPNANPELGWGSTLLAQSWMAPSLPTNPDVEVYPETPYRNDTSEFNRYQLGIGGPVEHFTPPAGYWGGNETSGGGAFTYRVPSGMVADSSVLPNSPYKDSSRLLVFAWRPAHWASWAFLVDGAKANNTGGEYPFALGGFQGARGNNEGAEFWVAGVREELDAPGEYVFVPSAPGSTSGTLYFYPNNTAVGSAPPSTGYVDPVLSTLVSIRGTPGSPAADITIRGVGFRDARATVMDPHGMPSGGDWALQRSASVELETTERVTVDGCVFDRIDGNGVGVFAYNRNASVTRSEARWIASSFVIQWGNCSGSPVEGYGPDCTAGNIPDGTVVAQNFIHELGIYEKQMSAYFEAKTRGATLSQNIFFNGPRAGFNINDMTGGGLLVEGNLLLNTCRESGDHGPINSWNRQVYETLDATTGLPTTVPATNRVHGNFIIANYNSQEAVDNDDGSAYWNTTGNFLVYSGNGLKSDFGGHDNWHHNNLYAYVGAAMHAVEQLPGHVDHFFNNTVVLTTTSLGSFTCTGASAFDTHANTYYTPTGDLVECGESLAQWQSSGGDPGSTVAAWPAPQNILDQAKALLAL